jgi:hypothetical protein
VNAKSRGGSSYPTPRRWTLKSLRGGRIGVRLISASAGLQALGLQSAGTLLNELAWFTRLRLRAPDQAATRCASHELTTRAAAGKPSVTPKAAPRFAALCDHQTPARNLQRLVVRRGHNRHETKRVPRPTSAKTGAGTRTRGADRSPACWKARVTLLRTHFDAAFANSKSFSGKAYYLEL